MPCGGLTKRGLAGDVGRGKTKFKVLNYLKAGTNSLQAPQCGKSGTWPRHLTPPHTHTATVCGLSMQLAPAAEKVHTKAAALNTATRERQCRGRFNFQPPAV